MHGRITNECGIRVAVADDAYNNAGIDSTEALYNAKLLAAAPELLKALIQLEAYFAMFSHDAIGHKKLAYARAAIKKAGGV